MGYFSNGTEGMMYQEQWCNRCVHDENQDCRVWLLHLVYNGEKDAAPILDSLIPPAKDGLSNGKCIMFIASKPAVSGEALNPCIRCGGAGVDDVNGEHNWCPRCNATGSEPKV